MMKGYFFRFLAVATLVTSLSLLTGGCAKKTVQTEEGAAGTIGAEEERMAMGAEESLDSKAWKRDGDHKVLEGRTSDPMLPVYFDFDKSGIRSDQVSRIRKNASYLKKNTGIRVRIEGNCDERGTNEYNMALGERRALSGKKYLVNLGVSSRRLKTISYGEEKPLNRGHDELSWSQNRRDDFVIVK